MSVLWDLFEITINFIQGFIMILFAHSYLGDKNDKRFLKSSGVLLAKNPHLRTTKKNKSSHGYGTKIICDIARKYHGKYDFYEEEGFFCCSVTLKK